MSTEGTKPENQTQDFETKHTIRKYTSFFTFCFLVTFSLGLSSFCQTTYRNLTCPLGLLKLIEIKLSFIYYFKPNEIYFLFISNE